MRRENVGLYRVDGLGILRNYEIKRKGKQIIQIFKSCGLNITIRTNLKTVDFLDVRLDFINKTSNHPPNILKELPKVINKRITDISCNQAIFDAAKTTYEQALRKSGFNE